MLESVCQEKLSLIYDQMLQDCKGRGDLPEFQTANAILAWAMFKMSETDPTRWKQFVLEHVEGLERDRESYKQLLFSETLDRS